LNDNHIGDTILHGGDNNVFYSFYR